MSKAATISRLEALLSRIRTRAAEPHRPATPPVRAVAAAPAAPARAPVPQPFVPAAVAPAPAAPAPFVPPAAPVAAQPPPSPVVPFVPAPVAARPAPAPVAPVAAPPVASAASSVAGFTPPAPRVVATPESTPPLSADDPFAEGTLPPPAPASGDVEFDVDVDVSPSAPPEPMATPEVGHDPTASVERLSAAPIAEPEPELVAAASSEAEDEEDAEDEGPSIQSVELLGDHEGIAGDEDEAIEEAPASSRRPVTTPPAERLADLAFGADEQPPRHTPPPKSGRLPAPPSAEFDPDVTGVRETSPSPLEPGPMPIQAAEPKKLVPEPARANLVSSADARVADLIGAAQSFDPATFLELLDASLSL